MIARLAKFGNRGASVRELRNEIEVASANCRKFKTQLTPSVTGCADVTV
jgi:hypothetical protein